MQRLENSQTPGNINATLKSQIDRGISLLKQGGIVAFPTDTIYGLGAAAYMPQSVKRVYEVKKRPLNMALPLLLADTDQIESVTSYVSPVAWKLIHNFLPGALTLVMFKSALVPDIVTAGGKTVAIRIPAHPVPIALIKGIKMPITGTSANLTGMPVSLTADDVRSQMGNKLDLVIDGGHSPGRLESTIIDLTGKKPLILREGAISFQQIKRVCGDVTVKKGD